MDNLRFKSLLQSTDLVGFVVGNCKTRAACRNGLKDGVYKSLQMQITGLETKVDPFFFFFFATSLFSLPSWIWRALTRKLIEAWNNKSFWKAQSFNLLKHTAGAPSISSIIRQFGDGLDPITERICVAASSWSLKASTFLSSLAFISTGWYPNVINIKPSYTFSGQYQIENVCNTSMFSHNMSQCCFTQSWWSTDENDFLKRPSGRI